MKNITILGSTGSIGTITLGIIKQYSDKFNVVGLAGGSNVELLAKQCRDFKPSIVSLKNKDTAGALKRLLGDTCGIEITWGAQGLIKVASFAPADMVVSAIVGIVGLIPTIVAIESGKDIALANKEILVTAGALLMQKVAEAGVNLIPVDSEHSAVFQCINQVDKSEISRIILTASGGPFVNFSAEQLDRVTLEQALRHPTWKMGQKITIDSASLMNKGLEVIEAHWLFNMPVDKIDVLIHPQSIIHSMVEMVDGSILAQLGITDMSIPIQYALSYPKRIPNPSLHLDLVKASPLSFSHPDTKRFPCLKYAYDAARAGGGKPVVLNAANEIAVKAFLNKEISFKDIPYIIKQALDKRQTEKISNIQQTLELDARVRKTTKNKLAHFTVRTIVDADL